MAVAEFRALQILREQLSMDLGARVELGIGDDCAVLRPGPGHQVLSVDACVEGVHFRREWLSVQQVAAKAFHAAVSDVAAMGAIPVGALCQVGYPESFTEEEFRAFGAGQASAARSLSCPIVGGNLTRAEALSISTTVVGEMAEDSEPLGRSGARPGDELWLVGELGLAHLGLRLLLAGRESFSGAAQFCVEAFRSPRARVQEGQELLSRAHACLDVSDGLSGDALHLAEASEVQVVIGDEQVAGLASQELRVVCRELGLEPLEVMLSGGEDYALLATGPAEQRPECARAIGRVASGHGVVRSSGKAVPVSFQH